MYSVSAKAAEIASGVTLERRPSHPIISTRSFHHLNPPPPTAAATATIVEDDKD